MNASPEALSESGPRSGKTSLEALFTDLTAPRCAGSNIVPSLHRPCDSRPLFRSINALKTKEIQ